MGQQTVARKINVTCNDLPVCCPMPGKELWNQHPRIYLPFDGCTRVICYYCSTEYILVDQSSAQGH